ncbi:uncharacterized protein LOC110852117 [Folsomia candida]|uniref:Transcription factor Ken n=1 Tax=Folsomia candida TaxID=158441 RepID=A0A226E666_FOLCA|nr:uncharacterized protein LOC110852117 [Folsomia candida]OXA52381.1 Transcription factor Ken [Folsomia candida]
MDLTDIAELTQVENDDWKEVKEGFADKYGIEISTLDMEDGIPPNYIKDSIQEPIFDISELCRRLQDKYDREWASEEVKEKDVITIRKNVAQAAKLAGIDDELIKEELDRITTSSICDVQRLINIEAIESLNPTPSVPSPEPPPPAEIIPQPPEQVLPPALPQAKFSKRPHCGPCETDYPTKTAFFSHWEEVHSSLKNTLLPNCKEVTLHVSSSSKCSKQPNANTVLELASKLKTCSLCSKAFGSLEEASVCMAEHNKIRCCICLFMFILKTEDGTTSAEMTKHMKDFHGKTTTTGSKVVFPCPFCNVVNGKVRTLVEHLAERHYNPALKDIADKQSVRQDQEAAAGRTATIQNTQQNSSVQPSDDVLKKVDVIHPSPSSLANAIPFRINPAALGQSVELKGDVLSRSSLGGRVIKTNANRGRFILSKPRQPRNTISPTTVVLRGAGPTTVGGGNVQMTLGGQGPPLRPGGSTSPRPRLPPPGVTTTTPGSQNGKLANGTSVVGAAAGSQIKPVGESDVAILGM